jgi:hypothetical protein
MDNGGLFFTPRPPWRSASGPSPCPTGASAFRSMTSAPDSAVARPWRSRYGRNVEQPLPLAGPLSVGKRPRAGAFRLCHHGRKRPTIGSLHHGRPRGTPMSPSPNLVTAVEHALRAPSVHNTQP